MRIRVAVTVAVLALPAVASAVQMRAPVVRGVSIPRLATVGVPWKATVSVTPPTRGTLTVAGPGTLSARLARRKQKGRYSATLTFTGAGTWKISVRVGGKTTALGAVTVDVPRDPLLSEPVAIAAEPSGALVVAQRTGAALVRLTNGRASSIATGPALQHVVVTSGSIYATSFDGVVYRVTGSTLTAVSPTLDASAAAVDAAGNIYIAIYAGCIKRIAPDGKVTTIAGDGTEGSTGDGGPATAARLFHPHALIVSGSALVVADTENRRLRRIDLATGIITRFGGDVGITVALAAGTDGSVYSADVVRSGAGGGITRTSPEGETARLLDGVDVNGVAVTPDGTVFANLWDERRIQRFNPITKRLEPVARG